MPLTRIFVSSVQGELAAERRAVRDFVQGDALLRRFFEVFLFEDLPAVDQRADATYLAEVDRCDLYVDLFGHDYGSEDAQGVSPTERDFDRATAAGNVRLVYLKRTADRQLCRRYRFSSALGGLAAFGPGGWLTANRRD